jgi:chromosome segregation ATPase
VKDLATREKQGVGLEERRKHASTKSKKLKKSMQEVSGLISHHDLRLTPTQDESARKEALRSIDENSEKIEREKKKLRNLEAELEREENVLEGIRDSLKGDSFLYLPDISGSYEYITVRQDPGIPRPNRSQTEGAPALDRQDQF